MKTKKFLLVVVIGFLTIFGSSVFLLSYSVASDSPVEEKIEKWADNHPQAAMDLGEWVSTHKDAAKAIFKWDLKHPDQSRAFVTWVISHSGKKSEIFTEEHTEWRRLNKIVESHREALNSFAVWCRFHPKATASLMQHPGALYWVGQHLYKP